MGRKLQTLMVGLAATVMTPETLLRADCGGYQPQGFDCAPLECVVPLSSLANPETAVFQFTSNEGEDPVPATFTVGNQGHVRVRAAAPLKVGAWRLEADSAEVLRVEVAERPTAFPQAVGNVTFLPGSTTCGEVLTPFSFVPKVAPREETVEVSIELGRPIQNGAWADIYTLRESDDVPSGPQKAADAPDPRARYSGAPMGVFPQPNTSRFVVFLSPVDIEQANRVAMEVFEPTGVRSGVIVAPIDDRPTPYLYCACAVPRSMGTAPLSGLFMLLGAFILRVSRRG